LNSLPQTSSETTGPLYNLTTIVGTSQKLVLSRQTTQTLVGGELTTPNTQIMSTKKQQLPLAKHSLPNNLLQEDSITLRLLEEPTHYHQKLVLAPSQTSSRKLLSKAKISQ